MQEKLSLQDVRTTSTPQECVENSANGTNLKSKKVISVSKKKAKSRSYAEICTHSKCEAGETRSIIGKYQPVLLTKLNKKK